MDEPFKAIVIDEDLLFHTNEESAISSENGLSKIIEIIKKANEKNILVIISCRELISYRNIKPIMEKHNIIDFTIVEKDNFAFNLNAKHDLLEKDCSFAKETNLNMLFNEIEKSPIRTEKKEASLLQQLNSRKSQGNAAHLQQFGIYQEIQTQTNHSSSTPEKIEALVFEGDLFTCVEKYKYLIADIIKIANKKNIPVIICCAESNTCVEIKKITDAHQLSVTITDQSHLDDILKTHFTIAGCLFVTLPNGILSKTYSNHNLNISLIDSENNFSQLSDRIKKHPKNIHSPENEFLAKRISECYKLTIPSIVLESENLLSIKFDEQDHERNTFFKRYNPKLDLSATTIEIKSRAQIERFVNEHGGDVAKLYDDAELNYSPMPEVIQGIVFEHDTLIQCVHQSEIINLIKQAKAKGITVFVRYAKSESESHLSGVLYTLEHQLNYQNLPIINQSDFNSISKNKDGLARDDYLYITIPNGTLYLTDTGFRTHALLITSENDLNYLSEKIELHDVKLLDLEKMRVAKNVRNTCQLSKMPSINLINGNLLHIVIQVKRDDAQKDDIQKISKLYSTEYGAEFDAERKLFKIKSQDQIERFIEGHQGNVKELYKQAGCTFKSSFECSQQ